MMDDDRKSSKGPSDGQGQQKSQGRANVVSRRNDQLDEELRGQLRKKNEESRKNMSDRGGRMPSRRDNDM